MNMERSGLGLGALVVGLVLSTSLVACGGGSNNMNMNPKPDGGATLGDAFITSGCETVTDCSPNACQTAKCNAATKMCVYTDKTCASDTSCPAETVCSKSVCNTSDGTWMATGANDGMACTTTGSEPGTCTSGSCAAIPTCYNSNSFNSVQCDSGSGSLTTGSNDPGGFSGASATVSTYACAPNEAGPELGYRISVDPSLTKDIDVTISLKLTDANGVVLANQTGIDLDLVILEGTCAGNSACANPATGTTFQGITAGTSNERVTFHADHTQKYYAVVDGKDMNQVGNYVLEVESCGQCAATTPSQTISCNMTVPVQASTSTGTNLITDYMCGPSGSKTAVTLAGKEIPFLFKYESGVARTLNASITGATAPASLLAISESYWGACDPTDCLASGASSGGNASISFSTQQSFSSFKRYWLLVDTPSTADSSFGLQLDCPAYCVSNYDLACGNSSTEQNSIMNGTTTGGSAVSTKYGPGAGCDGLTGLTGPESVVTFLPSPAVSATYTVTLTQGTVGKHLSMTIMDNGTTANPVCNPSATCLANTTVVATGYTGTRTTTDAAAAGIMFTGLKGHHYFIVVDGTDASGGDFDMKIVGSGSGSGCL